MAKRGLGVMFQRGLDQGDRNSLNVLTPFGSFWVQLWPTPRDSYDTCERYGVEWIWNGEFGTMPYGDKPHAECSLQIQHDECRYTELAVKEFEADTEDEVKRQVESWAHQQAWRAIQAVVREFS